MNQFLRISLTLLLLLGSLLSCTYSQSTTPKTQNRQDGDGGGDYEGPNFGNQVVKIINGVVTGDLSSILTGSFNFVPNEEYRETVKNFWNGWAGITTKKPTTATPLKSTNSTESTTDGEDEDEDNDNENENNKEGTEEA